ncbi:hypothetical protein [Candidatus Neomicrothrix sp.]|uniref:hypothetical protein n=1 Tax=Candidatus Neomicrothrix sp. TaxID=2719034 RepID=UPI0025964C57|nr:hypothetical protein [Candidatus Microthrix sp.]HMS48843.1 hypothetical protein [Candidatus Microthrix sp.]
MLTNTTTTARSNNMTANATVARPDSGPESASELLDELEQQTEILRERIARLQQLQETRMRLLLGAFGVTYE